MTVPTPGGRQSSRSTFTMAILAVAGIALFFAFISLGTWQVQRRAWKLDLIERVNERVHSQPVAVPGKETPCHKAIALFDRPAVPKITTQAANG